MHELSIVLSIVETVRDTCRKNGKSKVDRIEMEIGKLAGVDRSLLDMVWAPATRDTVLEEAERNIRDIPGLAKCLECGNEHEMATLYDPCPECGSFFQEILQGKELSIISIYAS